MALLVSRREGDPALLQVAVEGKAESRQPSAVRPTCLWPYHSGPDRISPLDSATAATGGSDLYWSCRSLICSLTPIKQATWFRVRQTTIIVIPSREPNPAFRRIAAETSATTNAETKNAVQANRNPNPNISPRTALTTSRATMAIMTIHAPKAEGRDVVLPPEESPAQH
jgi:hypothetical protein